MLPEVINLFESPLSAGTETVETIVSGNGFRLEHIRSLGDRSQPGFWYDQEASEWVALISGNATLEFEEGRLELTAGDAIIIPPHQRHCVTATSVDAVWIALHFD